MKVFLLLFLLHLVNKTAYGIPISAAESSATREDVGPAQQDVKRNEGEKRFKRSCSVVPFDVQCHGHCPYDEYEWNSVRSNSNCSDERVGTTYHCIDPEDESGNPIEACGVPKYCDKGKGPVISFPKGHSKTADIDCDWCPEDYFNPSESIRSDNNSKCPKVRNDCGRHGLIECDIVTGEKRHWTDSKCECDIKNNYFPLEGENKCTGQSINCVWNQPCKKSLEGFDQIHIYSMSEGKYVCQRGCKEGFEFKTSQSTECEPVQVEINGTRFDNETTIYDRSTLTPTTPEGTTITSSPPTTTTETHEEEDAGISRGKTIGIGIAIGLVIFFGIYIVYGCYKNKERTSGKRRDQEEYKRGNSSSEGHVQLETLMPQSGGTDLEPHVSGLTYVLCWPYYLCLKEGTSGRKLVGKSQKEHKTPEPDVTDLDPHDKPGAPGVPKCKTTTEDSITLSWTPPNRDGGNQVTGYILERREKGDDIWETSSYSVNQVTEFTVEGLQDGKEYEFRVAACNNAGTGEFSNYSEPIKVQPPPNKQIWIEELPKDLLDTPLSNEMCVGFHDYFGHDWEIIAKHLKLRQATIDHIDADKRSQSLKIDRMIRTYVDEYQPTVGDFLRLLKSCSQTPTIEWTLLKNHFEKML